MASVLIVESEEPLVRLMSWFLVEAGHEVTAVKDVLEAGRRFETYHPDVIIVNTHLADDAKSRCLEQWRTLTPGSRILDVVDTLAGGPAGADAVLRLPFHADTLIETVEALVSDKT